MKRAAILSLTAFYLLLSTGMYVCLMHCTTADVVSLSSVKTHQQSGKMAMSDMPCCEKKAQKPVKKTSNGCDKHGSYLVKENLKPAAGFDLDPLVALLAQPSTTYSPTQILAIDPAKISPYGPSPPHPSGREYLIQIRTLLI